MLGYQAQKKFLSPIFFSRQTKRNRQNTNTWAGLFRGGGIFFFLELELQISTPRSLKKPVQFPH